MTEFETRFYKNFAVKFVDKYEQDSPLAAGIYAAEHIKLEKMDEAKPFVDAEFLKRGYYFDEEDTQQA